MGSILTVRVRMLGTPRADVKFVTSFEDLITFTNLLESSEQVEYFTVDEYLTQESLGYGGYTKWKYCGRDGRVILSQETCSWCLNRKPSVYSKDGDYICTNCWIHSN